MMVENYAALREAGVSDKTAKGAARVIEKIEHRMIRLEVMTGLMVLGVGRLVWMSF